MSILIYSHVTYSMSAVRDEVVANVTRLEQRISELQYNVNSNHGNHNHGKQLFVV